MTILKLVTGADNKILRTKSEPIKKIDRKIKKLAADMIETMEHANGVGLAGPQVGVNLQIFIAHLNYGTDQQVIIPMINAELSDFSEELDNAEEGCLSIPEKFSPLKRYKSLTVTYTDLKGKRHTLKLEGLNARIMQHENDHLDGMLYVDRL